jgi:hypothetical protein
VTDEEVDRVLLFLSSTWPQSKILDATIASWASRLSGMDYGLTVSALKRLADTEQWWPAMSTVVTEVAALKRAAEPMWKELPPSGVPLQREAFLTGLAEMRAKLR